MYRLRDTLREFNTQKPLGGTPEEQQAFIFDAMIPALNDYLRFYWDPFGAADQVHPTHLSVLDDLVHELCKLPHTKWVVLTDAQLRALGVLLQVCVLHPTTRGSP